MTKIDKPVVVYVEMGDEHSEPNAYNFYGVTGALIRTFILAQIKMVKR